MHAKSVDTWYWTWLWPRCVSKVGCGVKEICPEIMRSRFYGGCGGESIARLKAFSQLVIFTHQCLNRKNSSGLLLRKETAPLCAWQILELLAPTNSISHGEVSISELTLRGTTLKRSFWWLCLGSTGMQIWSNIAVSRVPSTIPRPKSKRVVALVMANSLANFTHFFLQVICILIVRNPDISRRGLRLRCFVGFVLQLRWCWGFGWDGKWVEGFCWK